MVRKRNFLAPGFVNIQIALLILVAFAGYSAATPTEANAQTRLEASSNKAFETLWQRTEQPIYGSKTDRSWYWGPGPLANSLYEPYAESPNGRRLVQYYDKARMEINDPQANQVSNGLLVTELITGRIQQGDNLFDEPVGGGAKIPVVGDLSNTSPTYQQLARVYNIAAGLKVGDPASILWYGSGPIGQYGRYNSDPKTIIATVENGFGIPQAFWDFLNRKGVVYVSNRYVEDVIADWQASVGLPITEAYWVKVKVEGVEQDVLFQGFERRVLSYTPANAANFQVEMGNVGLHYVQWRYKGDLPQYDTPILSAYDSNNPTQPKWYKVNEVLNIRTAPSSKAPQAFNSVTRPFVTQLQRGDRIQVLRAVKGEAVEPGFDRWYQIYEKPDLFVYGKYVELFSVPDFPKPPRTYNGLWVAVSIKSQMMAIYNNKDRVYTTMVATGRSGYDTVVGSFSAIGGYRPASQTMAGGNRAAGDGYSLEEVRNVTYFYRDFAIHGSYWHAKYGIAPQSHGCVNSTVYDAGLVWQLPVGTPVEVYL